MSALLFPTADALRLALVSGVIPPPVAHGPVAAGVGDGGELWFTPSGQLSADLLTALARIGVRAQAPPPGFVPAPFPCWAAPLPLKPDPTPPASPMLVRLPAERLAGFVAAARRLRPQPVQFLPDRPTALVLLPHPPLHLIDQSDVIAYYEAAPNVWLRLGWQHPLVNALSVPDGNVAFVDPPGEWHLVPNPPFLESAEVFPIHVRLLDTVAEPSRSVGSPPPLPAGEGSESAEHEPGVGTNATSTPPPPTSLRSVRRPLPNGEGRAPANPTLETGSPTRPNPPTVRVPVTLRKHPSDAAEALWAFDGPPEQLADLFRGTDERVLSRFLFAVVEANGSRRVWAKPVSRGKTPVLPEPFHGFVPHSLLAGVFLPANKVLAPTPRTDRLVELLKVHPKALVCVDAAGGSPVVHRIPPSAFRPLADLLEYVAPHRRTMPVWNFGDNRLVFAEVRLIDSFEPTVPLMPVTVIPPPPVSVPTGASTSWITKLADRLLGPKRPERPKSVARSERKSSRIITPAVRSTPDRDIRRRQLEQSIVAKPTASVWAELANATAETGKPTDAALCWVNALWDCDPLPPEWLVEWVRAESRGKFGPRLAAAVTAEIGFSPDPHPDAGRLPELVRKLDAHESELPVRAVWLARLGAARAVGGDPLALARCRDRLLARLAAEGPSLDLDAPAFLRFHGSLGGDRFRDTREWLLHVREPMHKWLHKLSTGHKLGWAGLDPDPIPTTAYADLMLAWGLSRLGERTKADELTRHAERVLERIGGHSVVSAVHTTLVARFKARIRDAQHGRGQPPHPGTGNVVTGLDVAALPDDPDAAYAVKRLTERSRVLSPQPAGNPYGGHDLAPLLGTDALGHRLIDLIRNPSPEGVASILAATATDPTAATLPRLMLVSAELPVTFPHRTADRLMLLFPRAVELLPEAVRLSFDSHTDPHAYLQRLTKRLIAAACRLALRYDLNGGFGAFTRFLLDVTAAGDEVVKAAGEEHLGDLFTTLRKLGLTDLAGELAGAWADRPIGWFVMGRDETGWALLDAASQRLFVNDFPDERARTTAAFEYVAALAHAPPRLALGRLEELFQRLDRVTTAGGTARFFALTPLELIDRAVSAVVTDEFNIGPTIRRWLDDDEFVIRRRIARDLDAALARDTGPFRDSSWRE